MVDPTLQTALCGTLERLVNAALQFDPGSRAALNRLEGQVMAVSLTRPAMTLYLQPGPQTLQVLSHYEGDVTTRLQGSPTALAKLAISDRLSLADSGVEVYGSTALLVSWQQLIQQLDIDWEDALSAILGDMGSHGTAAGVRQFWGWLNGRHHSFDRLLGEYLTEELRATPSRRELDSFYTQVTELSLASDRLAARVAHLQEHLQVPRDTENRH